MKNYLLLAITLFAMILIVPVRSMASDGANVKTARKVIGLLNKGEYFQVTSNFDSTMKKAAPESRLRAIWTSLIKQTGKLQEELSDTSFDFNGYNIVIVTCQFVKSKLDVKVVFDRGSRIAGLFFAPHVEPAKEEGSGGSSPSDSLRGAPYISKDVTFKNSEANVTLGGTLTLPNSIGRFPAVLLIAGSGPNTRNETIAGHKIFLAIADYLTRHGIAVLRYDKRGVGQSTGNYGAATTLAFASDALAGVEYLKTVKQVDPKEIGLVGHSEGAEIAPIVADRSKSVAFIVMLGGPGVPGYKIVMSQVALIDKASGVKKSSLDSALALERRILTIVRTEKDSARAALKLRDILEKENKEQAAAANASVSELLSPWYREFVSYDPRPALEKVKCPVLALWGSKDLQVPPAENMPAVRKALRKGGNRNFKLVEMKGLNHLFQTAKTGSPLEYGMIKEAISPRALSTVTKWILKVTRDER